MPKLIVLITSRVEEGHAIGQAWYEAGAPGVTFIESFGIRRLRDVAHRAEILPGMLSLMQILKDDEKTSLMVFSLVPDEEIVDRLLAAAEAILGDLTLPDNGITFVIDVERAIGLVDHRKPRGGS